MSAARQDPYGHHINIHPITHECLDCGSTPEEIDDRLWECDRCEGPHKLALIAILREMRSPGFQRVIARREAAGASDQDEATFNRLRQTRTEDLRQLKASFDALKALP